MVTKKVVIGIVIVLVAVVAFVAIGISESGKPADVRYDYEAELSDGFNLDSFIPDVPSEGMQYVIVHYTIVNDHENDPISTNSLVLEWTAKCDGVIYSSDWVTTTSHPDENRVDVAVGGKASSVSVIEVPKGIALEDIELAIDYMHSYVTFERDDTLM